MANPWSSALAAEFAAGAAAAEAGSPVCCHVGLLELNGRAVVAALARDWRADYRWRRAGSAQWSVSSVELLVGLLLLVWCLR